MFNLQVVVYHLQTTVQKDFQGESVGMENYIFSPAKHLGTHKNDNLFLFS